MALGEIKEGFISGYKQFLSIFPANYQVLVNLLIFSLLISLYSIFTWYFYQNLSKKDLLALNLRKYNRTTHPLLNKTVAAILNVVEYLIILPFLVFFWFAILALVIFAMSNGEGADKIIIVAASVIAAIRILSYYSEDLSRELAKLFPFTMLTIFLLSANSFSIDSLLSFLTNLKSFFSNIFYYLLFIAVLELILRITDTIINFFISEEE